MAKIVLEVLEMLFGPAGTLLIVFGIGPIATGLLIFVLVLASRRRCPYCRGSVPKSALICKHCGRALTPSIPPSDA